MSWEKVNRRHALVLAQYSPAQSRSTGWTPEARTQRASPGLGWKNEQSWRTQR